MKRTDETRFVVTIKGPIAEAVDEYDKRQDPRPGPSCIVRTALRHYLTQRGIIIRPNKPKGVQR